MYVGFLRCQAFSLSAKSAFLTFQNVTVWGSEGESAQQQQRSTCLQQRRREHMHARAPHTKQTRERERVREAGSVRAENSSSISSHLSHRVGMKGDREEGRGE